MKTIFTAMLLIAAVISATAQTAQINKIWTEHNVTQNGQKGMTVHTEFSVQEMMNRRGYVQVWFKYSNNEKLIGYGKQEYKTPSGYLTVNSSYTPNYARTTFNDFKIFFPYDEFKKSVNSAGTFNLKFNVGIMDHNNKPIVTSDFVSFKYTNGNNSNANPPAVNFEEQKIIGGANYYDPDNLIVETKQGQILKDITSDEMGSIAAPNLYEFRTNNGEIINVSFKNRLSSASGNYQITGSFKTAYLNGIMSSATVFYVTSYKKL